STASPARWARQHLAPALAARPELAGVRAALAKGAWLDAHRALAQHLTTSPQTFVIAPRSRPAISNRILGEFPDSQQNATAMADRIVAGDYDLLGYRALRFDHGADGQRSAGLPPSRIASADRHSLGGGGQARPSAIDWHYDPIHERRAPSEF